MVNPYDILGLPPNASKAKVKKAYRLYVSKLHPDKHDGEPFFDELLKRINEAYKTICASNGYSFDNDSRDSSVSQSDDSKDTDAQNIINALRQEVQNLRHERTTQQRLISDLQTKIRDADAMQLQINILQATIKMYESTSKLREKTLSQQDEYISYYKQQTPSATGTSQTAMNWIVALVIGLIIFIIILITSD